MLLFGDGGEVAQLAQLQAALGQGWRHGLISVANESGVNDIFDAHNPARRAASSGGRGFFYMGFDL
jgi:hypothetical protein